MQPNFTASGGSEKEKADELVRLGRLSMGREVWGTGHPVRRTTSKKVSAGSAEERLPRGAIDIEPILLDLQIEGFLGDAERFCGFPTIEVVLS